MMETSRRDFLKGALAASVGATAAMVAPGVAMADEELVASEPAGKHTWEIAPAPIDDVVDTYDYDIVIVGAGMAGTGAAEAAARFGAKVAVLERNYFGRFCGADLAAWGSKLLKEAGYDMLVDDPVRLEYAWSQQTANYDLIRQWAEQCGPVIDYVAELCEANGVSVKAKAGGGTAKAGWAEFPERFRVYQDAIGFSSKDGEKADEPHQFLGRVLTQSAQDNGAEFFFEHRGIRLVGDAATGITGVIAEDADGNHIQFNASKGVILATGDIGGNQEMIDAFAPLCNNADDNAYAPAGFNNGDAILMGCWAGAAISRSSAAPMVHTFLLPLRKYKLTSFNMTWLAVNADGRRYGAEMPFEPTVTNARMSTAGNKAWSIFDSDYETYVKAQYPTVYESFLEVIPEQFETGIADGVFIVADTLEELAEKLEIPADNLKNAVEDWNAMYEKGEDTRFGLPAQLLSQVKTAPFYATKVNASILTIPFGLHVDINSQVLTDADEPIAGLFAVGNAQGDFFGNTYPVHCPGCSTSRALVYGQLVGEALAQDTVIANILK